MIDVLLLAREYGPERVRQAVEVALQFGCSDVAAVRYQLSVGGREEQRIVAPAQIGALNRYDRPQPSLEDYDLLRPGWPVDPVAPEVIQ